MSYTDRNTFGLEHGKIGDRIAVVLDGKQIYKARFTHGIESTLPNT